MENTKSSIQTLEKKLEKQYPTISENKKKTVVREMLFSPENRMIEIDDKRRLSAKDLRFVMANALETPLQNRNVQYANSIEVINSGVDPVSEYFSWLNETVSILNHLNDGFITKEDASEREVFLDLTDQREADLMLCLSLYDGCKSTEARKRAQFIRYKLQKLREMRTAIKFLTRSGQDVETTRSEYDAAIPYYKYFKNLKKLPFGYDMPYEQKVKLGISHDEDEDLQEDYDHYAFLLNEMLDEMKRQDEEAQKALQKTFERLDQQNSEQNEDLTRR